MKLLLLGPGLSELIILLSIPALIIAVIISMTSGKKEREMESLGLEPIDLSKVRTIYSGGDIFLNILWYLIPPLGGLFMALVTALQGLFWCVTIVGLPLGLGLLQYAKFLLRPHGHVMVSKKLVTQLTGEKQNALWKSFSLIVRIVYFPFGLFSVIGMTFTAFVSFISIIGIPSGLVYVKSLGTVFNPVNKICVPATVMKLLEERMMAACYRKTMQPNTPPSTTSNNEPSIQQVEPQLQPVVSSDTFMQPTTENKETLQTNVGGKRKILMLSVIGIGIVLAGVVFSLYVNKGQKEQKILGKYVGTGPASDGIDYSSSFIVLLPDNIYKQQYNVCEYFDNHTGSYTINGNVLTLSGFNDKITLKINGSDIIVPDGVYLDCSGVKIFKKE